nr:neprosin family prolyl endopeptidase [Actinomycetota bacterium]
AELGPKGTVPTARRNVDAINSSRNLGDYLSKHGRAALLRPDGLGGDVALPEDETLHKYAYSAQFVTAYGCEGNINAWDPYLEWSDEFSLGQCAVVRGSGVNKQTIETGHQEFRDLYGDWVPHLFVFYTTNGYTEQGDNKGGYNQDVDGWVQYSSTIYPEALSSPVSAFDGTQYIMNLKWQLWEGNWWLRCNGTWVGYYPASLFNDSGLRNEAEKIAWYGEIVDGEHEGTTRTDMGNGRWPYEGWQHCAYMSNLAYQSDTRGGMSRYNPSSVYASHPKCYGIEEHFDNTGSWGPYFWWGGSGKNSDCP